MFCARTLLATTIAVCLLPSAAWAQPKLGIRGEGSEDGVVVLQTYANTPVTRLKWVSGPNPNRTWELTPNDIIRRINGRRICDMTDLRDAMRESGQYVDLTVWDARYEEWRVYRAKMY